MSTIVDFFIAPGDDAASDVAGHGLAEVATRWAELGADDGEEIPPEFASDILSEMASLARTATGRGHQLYRWWG